MSESPNRQITERYDADVSALEVPSFVTVESAVTRARRRYESRRDNRRYLYDPVGFLNTYIDWPQGMGLADYQEETLDNIPKKKRQAIRGPHGLGKSTTASLALIWFALTREQAGIDWKVPTTASAWRHLTIYLWPEVHKWLRRVKWDELGMSEPTKRTQLLDLRLKLDHGAASAIASDDPVNLEGAHADSILYIFDEAKAIPNETWDAAEGALSGDDAQRTQGELPEAFALAISTPGDPAGRFYDIHQRKAGLEDWHARHVTLEEAIKARRISKNWAEARKRQWGEWSAVYRNRVLGEFHASDEDSVIPLAWLEESNARWQEWDNLGRPDLGGKEYLGVDVARSGSDFTALANRKGPVVIDLKRLRLPDTMKITNNVTMRITKTKRPVVDSIGIGAGVVDRLRELGIRVIAYTGSKKTHVTDRTKEFGFANTRSAAYWYVRELLDPSNDGEILLPPDDQLTGDLTAPKWSLKGGQSSERPRIEIEAKDKLTARLGRSPDVGDAVVMSFWPDKSSGSVEVASPRDLLDRARQEAAAKRAEQQNDGDGPKDRRRTAPRIGRRRRRGVLSLSPLEGFRNRW